MNWIEVPKGTYTLRNEREKISNCQLEFDTSYVRADHVSLDCIADPQLTELVMRPSSRTRLKATGLILRPCEFCPSISSVLVAKVSFPNRIKIRSFRLQTW